MKYELNNIYNEDCYEAIKNIPDKSIDLIVTDPPYMFVEGGIGYSDIAQRKNKNKIDIYSLDTEITKNKIVTGGGCFGTKKRDYHSQISETNVSLKRKEYMDYISNNGKDKESERLRIIANGEDNKNNLKFVSNGIKTDLLYDYIRIMKKINIYIYGAIKIN